MLRVCLVADGLDERAANLWAYTVSHFDVTNVFLIGGSPMVRGFKPFKHAVEIDDVAAVPGKLVVMQPYSARSVRPSVALSAFSHPGTATYFFGSDHENLERDVFKHREPDAVVGIESFGENQMHAHVAAAITLYDRRVRLG